MAAAMRPRSSAVSASLEVEANPVCIFFFFFDRREKMYHIGKRTTPTDSTMNPKKILHGAEILRTPKSGSYDRILRRADINIQPYSDVGSFDQETAPATLIQVEGQPCAIPTGGSYAPKFTTIDGYPESLLPRSQFNEPVLKYYANGRDIHPALFACSAFASGKCDQYLYRNVQRIIYP